jgi:Tol biopolymer transport system component
MLKPFHHATRLLLKTSRLVMILFLLGSSLGCSHSKGEIPALETKIRIENPRVEHIVWSPVGDVLLVSASDPQKTDVQLYFLDLKSLNKELIMESKGEAIFGESWAPDGNHIAVTASASLLGDKDSAGLWVINKNDYSRTFISPDVTSASWSPDGSLLAVVLKKKIENSSRKEISLELINMNTNEKEALLADTGGNDIVDLDWSPDGKYLLLSMSNLVKGAGVYDIFIFNLATRQLSNLTPDNLSISGNPAWSLDGDIIAYTRRDEIEFTHTLHLMKPDGTCDRAIPINDAWSPAWSPDGTRLAFVKPDGIYILNLQDYLGEKTFQDICK